MQYTQELDSFTKALLHNFRESLDNQSFLPKLILIIFISHFVSRESIDAYTIAAAPIYGSLRDVLSVSFTGGDGQSNYDLNEKAPLLSDLEKDKGDQCGILESQTSCLCRTSLHEKHAGELPISQGCTFMQTLFNGNLLSEYLC